VMEVLWSISKLRSMKTSSRLVMVSHCSSSTSSCVGLHSSPHEDRCVLTMHDILKAGCQKQPRPSRLCQWPAPPEPHVTSCSCSCQPQSSGLGCTQSGLQSGTSGAQSVGTTLHK
jgi:hypothetical protein